MHRCKSIKYTNCYLILFTENAATKFNAVDEGAEGGLKPPLIKGESSTCCFNVT